MTDLIERDFSRLHFDPSAAAHPPSPKPSSSTPSHVHTPSPTALVTAGQNLMGNPDTRKAIIRLLAKADLLAFMTVNRDCFFDAIPAVYSCIKYAEVAMISQSPWAASYSAAVRSVDARTNNRVDRAPTGISWLAPPTCHDADVLEAFLHSLTSRFPNLSRIHFAQPKWTPGPDRCFWVITLGGGTHVSAASGDSALAAAQSPLQGHIDVVHTCEFPIDAPPPKSFTTCFLRLPPPPKYTIAYRFNLILSNVTAGATNTQWTSIVREGGFAKDLHDRIDLSTLDISLGDLTNLYALQQAAGREERNRLHFITAKGITTLTIHGFMTFSNIASTSLVTLDLGYRARVPAPDLLALIWTVRDHLTSLEELMIGLLDPGQAERESAAALTERSLDGGGRIRLLRIATDGRSSPHLDLIRVLAALCTADASIYVGQEYVEGEQTKYLRYLLAQSPARRRHLAVVDFSTLFVHELDQVSELEYDEADRPARYGASRPAIWCRKLVYLRQIASDTPSPELGSILAVVAKSTGHLLSISATASARQVLLAAEAVLSSAKAARQMTPRVSEIGKGIDEIVTELRRYIYHLELLR